MLSILPLLLHACSSLLIVDDVVRYFFCWSTGAPRVAGVSGTACQLSCPHKLTGSKEPGVCMRARSHELTFERPYRSVSKQCSLLVSEHSRIGLARREGTGRLLLLLPSVLALQPLRCVVR